MIDLSHCRSDMCTLHFQLQPASSRNDASSKATLEPVSTLTGYSRVSYPALRERVADGH
jgi:hypothetical protein